MDGVALFLMMCLFVGFFIWLGYKVAHDLDQ